jgi:hypothetical protein
MHGILTFLRINAFCKVWFFHTLAHSNSITSDWFVHNNTQGISSCVAVPSLLKWAMFPCHPRRPLAGVEQDQGRVWAELHPSSWWLVWTSSAGDGIGRWDGAGGRSLLQSRHGAGRRGGWSVGRLPGANGADVHGQLLPASSSNYLPELLPATTFATRCCQPPQRHASTRWGLSPTQFILP